MLLATRSPYENSRLDLLARDLFESIGATHNDYVLIDPYSIGDAYHTLCLLKSFREKHVKGDSKLFFCCLSRTAPIVSLFGVADKVVVVNPDHFILEMAANRYPSAPGMPIVMAINMPVNGWLGRLCDEGLVSPLNCKRLMLGIDFDSPIAKPVVPPELHQKAEKIALMQGLIPGKSMIIFNHAMCWSPLPVEAYADAVKSFPGPVFTDIVGNLPVIPGTQPISMPLDCILPISELAGHVLALRSGIVDIISSADIDLFCLYPRTQDINLYPRKIGMESFNTDKKVMRDIICNSYPLAKIGLCDESFEKIIALDDSDDNHAISQKIAAAFDAHYDNFADEAH